MIVHSHLKLTLEVALPGTTSFQTSFPCFEKEPCIVAAGHVEVFSINCAAGYPTLNFVDYQG